MIKITNFKQFFEVPLEEWLKFGKFTEPLEDGIVTNISKEVKHPMDAVRFKRRLKGVEVDVNRTKTVKEMESAKIYVKACGEMSLLAASILRKAGFPTAILVTVPIDMLYQARHLYQDIMYNISVKPNFTANYVDHFINLVYYRDRWWLLDVTREVFTRYVNLFLIRTGQVPIMIIDDYEVFGTTNKIETTKQIWEIMKEKILLVDWDLMYATLHPE